MASKQEDGSQLILELEEPTREIISGSRLFLVMFSLTLAVFLMLLDSSIVATATPKITSDFHSLDDIGWYGTAYLLANCAFQPLSGKIFTFFDIKWTFLAFFAVFEIGSALCGAAASSTMLIVGRAVAGLGASGLLNGAYTIIALTVQREKQAGLRAILMGLSFFGLLAGPLIGGALTEYTTWRWCFYINLPCGAVIALFLLLVPMPRYRIVGDGSYSLLQKLRKLDLIGFLLFTPTIIMLILALQRGGTYYSWNSSTIIGLFCGTFGTFIVFLEWERRMGATAMIPLSLLGRRVVVGRFGSGLISTYFSGLQLTSLLAMQWSSCLDMAFLIGSVFTTSYYLPVYFQAVLGASPVQSGIDMLPQVITNMIVTIVTGPLVARVGYYVPFALGGAAFTSVGTGLLSTLEPTSTAGQRIGYQILQGFQGLGFQIPILAVQHGVPGEQLAVATSLVVFSQNLSGALFLSLAEIVFSSRLRHFLSAYVPGADVERLTRAGAAAADIASSVPAELLPAVRSAYSDTFDSVMYLATGSACATFLAALAMNWVRINGKKAT